MKKIILEIIGSYEKRISAVSKIIEGSRDLIESYREHRVVMLDELRSNLAHAESLRKKDFDNMMSQIRSLHKVREEEVKMILKKCVEDHRNMAEELRTLLEEKRRERQEEEQERLFRFRLMFEKIKKEQAEREKEVRKILGRFQSEQYNFMEVMNYLLRKGKNVRTQELKSAVQNLSSGNYYPNNIKKKENYYVGR
ncbi:MAG: hypothetical protein KKD31_19815 [Bacteroidetes bacterium]|nr:hypothetical protein [Bacteroidota bacterium]